MSSYLTLSLQCNINIFFINFFFDCCFVCCEVYVPPSWPSYLCASTLTRVMHCAAPSSCCNTWLISAGLYQRHPRRPMCRSRLLWLEHVRSLLHSHCWCCCVSKTPRSSGSGSNSRWRFVIGGICLHLWLLLGASEINHAPLHDSPTCSGDICQDDVSMMLLCSWSTKGIGLCRWRRQTQHMHCDKRQLKAQVRDVESCDVLWCAVLWCVVLWCVVMCCDVLWCVVLCCDVLWCIHFDKHYSKAQVRDVESCDTICFFVTQWWFGFVDAIYHWFEQLQLQLPVRTIQQSRCVDIRAMHACRPVTSVPCTIFGQIFSETTSYTLTIACLRCLW